MSKPKGLPKTGGRPKGSRNKASIQKEAEIAKSGLTPLDYMLSVLRDEKNPRELRLEASRSAAPYVHPKLAQVEHTGKGGTDLIPKDTISPNEMARRVAHLLTLGVREKKNESAGIPK